MHFSIIDWNNSKASSKVVVLLENLLDGFRCNI